MLFAGKFPRFAFLAALLIPLLLILDLQFIRASSTRLFASNTLLFAIVALASFCCLRVALLFSGYVRQVWLLIFVALALEAVAQALSTYYQSFVPGSLFTPEPSDILFFIWAAPAFMIFLPRSSDESSGVDTLRLLDYLQVAIVVITIYLYFFYAPARWRSDQFGLIRGLLLLYIGRDLLLSAGFFFRSRSSLPSWFRTFSSVFALVFLVAALSDVVYIATLKAAVGNATWGDLFWIVPYLVIIFFAVTFEPLESASRSFPSTATSTFFASQFLPVGLPLLVILLARAISRDQFLLGWLAVIASVACSSARLILTNRKQRFISDHLLSIEHALRRSEQMLSTAFRSSPDSYSINLFPDGPYIEVNEGFTNLTGYSREETLGKTPSQMDLWVKPTERARVLAGITQTGDVRDVEFHFRTKTGQTRVGLMSTSLVELDSRACALVVVRDITARKEAEDILRTSEERFRSLVQNLTVGIVVYDPNVRILYTNQAVLDLFGTTHDRVMGKTISELGVVAIREDGSTIPYSELPVPSVIASRKPLRSHLIGWRKRNSADAIWTLLDVVPEYSSTGELLRVVVSITDLTEQRRAAEALRKGEERFRTLVRDLHVSIVTYDSHARIIFANKAASDLLNIPLDQLMGKTSTELGLVPLREDGSVIPAHLRPVATVIATRQPIRSLLIGWRRADYDDFWTLLDAVPEFSSTGELLRVVVSVTDLTAQRRAAEALRESEERFRTLVRDLHVAVVLNRPDGAIEFANPAAYRMFGVPEGTAVGRLAEDFGVVPITEDGKDVPFEQRPVPLVLRTRTPIETGPLGLRYPGSPNKIVWVFGNVVPQFDAHGNVIRVISAFSDITEMKNAERSIHWLSTQLLQLQDEERRRLGRELHDGLAQTVLAINLSLAQLRQSLKPGEEAAARALEKARSLTQQMSREIRTLSYLLHPPLLDDLGLVSALKEYTHGFGERSGIDTQLFLLSKFDRLPQPVELALFRVVQESLANIQRHSGSSKAKIRLRQEDSLVTLEIVDFGRGMKLPSNGRPQPREARLGVGIPGMRERMSQLGGRLDIHSGPGGTTVRATISLSLSTGRKDQSDVHSPDH